MRRSTRRPSRALDQQFVDVALLGRRPAAALAGKDQIGLAARQFQDPRIDQGIVNDVVGQPQRVQRMQRQQPGVAWAGPASQTSPGAKSGKSGRLSS